MSESPQHAFKHLPEDIFFTILCLCDASTVLIVSQTCRMLHTTANDSGIWRAVVRDLQSRWILESDISGLAELSSRELRALVQRAVVGPRSWSPSDAGAPLLPLQARRIVLDADIYTGPGVLTWENDAKLVANGRYVVFRNNGRLECYSVKENRRVWSHVPETPATHRASVHDFAVGRHPERDGDWMVVMVCERTYPAHGALEQRQNYVTILEVNPETGKHFPLLVTRVLDSRYDNPFSRPILSGYLAAAVIPSENNVHLVLDWQRHKFLLLKHSGGSGRVALTPTHVILKTRCVAAASPSEKPALSEMLHVLDASAAFDDAPDISALGASTEPIDASTLPFSTTKYITRLPSGTRDSTDDEMVVHACPLRRDVWRVWVYCSTLDERWQLPESKVPSSSILARLKGHSVDDSEKGVDPELTHILCRYDLERSGVEGPKLTERLHAPATDMYLRSGTGIAYSGHTEIFDAYNTRQQRILPPPNPSRGRTEFSTRICIRPAAPRNSNKRASLLAKVRNTVRIANTSDADEEDDDGWQGQERNFGVVTLEKCGDWIHVAPYAGALTYATYKDLHVVYYD
ncbi:F-box domain-containing protein [Mycena kentingensis (nom. inval.)]|nr:F-box domain-containing protein [Mycena kentingensis (nom. inval.)]